LSFPARELWLETIQRRRPVGITRLSEDLDGYAGDTAIEGEVMSGWGLEDSVYLKRTTLTPGQQAPFLGDVPEFGYLFGESLDVQAAKGWATPDPWGNQTITGSGISGTMGKLPNDSQPGADPIFFPDLQEAEASESHVIALRHGNSKDIAKVIQELLKKGSHDPGELDEVRVLLLQREAELSRLDERLREADRLSRDLGQLEKDYQAVARARQSLQESLGHLNSIGIRTDVVAPRKALAGQVTAVARELDLVVISIGRDAGVYEGDEFTIYRGGEFVGKIAVDRVHRAWASGRIVLKGKAEPRIGDQASNNVLAVPGKGGQQEPSAAPPQPFRMGPRRWALQGQVTAVAKDLDLVVLSIGRDAGVSEGDEFTISRGNEMVCKVAIDRVDRAWASGRIVTKGKSEPRIGDQASTNVPVNPEKGVKPEPRPALPHPRKVVTITGDEVGLAGLVPSTVKVGDVYVLARDWQYVAAVQVITVADSGVKARILPRLRALSVQEGDAAVRIDSRASLWSVLPEKIRQEIVSERALAEARAKLGWLRKAAR
jgi:hypothetical protein